jgi:outer membrane protein OmpA-like peptidoglycan-associated protein
MKVHCIWILTLLSICLHGQEPFFNPGIQVQVLPADQINTKNLESSPYYYGNGIIYVYARERSNILDPQIGMPFFELMYSELGPEGLPLKASSFSPNIRSKYHEGPSSFPIHEKTIYYTRSNFKNGASIKDSDDNVHLKIFTAEKGPEDWINVQELPFCSDNYSVCHPAVSADGQWMIFSSNMAGGMGGMDLYYVKKENDRWHTPVNLGDELNTSGNELFPFLHESGTLFFSSNGHEGFGGLDLYGAQKINDRFTNLKHLPRPFNSRKDDLGFILDSEGIHGFFASDRKGGKGKDDIYSFRIDKSLFSIPPDEKEELAYIRIIERTSKQPIPGSAIWVFEIGPDGPIGIENYYETELVPSGTEEEELYIRLTRKQNFEKSTASAVADQSGSLSINYKEDKEYLFITKAEAYADAELIVRATDLENNNPFKIILDSVRSETINCVQIEGMIMSKEDGNGIDMATVKLENLCDGSVMVIQSNSLGIYQLCIPKDCDYQLIIEKDSFVSHSMKINPDIESSQIRKIYLDKKSALEESEESENLEEGTVIVLENIYYDFNKSAIRTGAARDLDALSRIMKNYPSMTVELIAHTDSRGTDSYNLELSKRRAISAKDYIVARNISSDRILTKAMGETQIRNRCLNNVPCSDNEHAYNRRTEVKVLKLDENIKVRYGNKAPGKQK